MRTMRRYTSAQATTSGDTNCSALTGNPIGNPAGFGTITPTTQKGAESANSNTKNASGDRGVVPGVSDASDAMRSMLPPHHDRPNAPMRRVESDSRHMNVRKFAGAVSCARTLEAKETP